MVWIHLQDRLAPSHPEFQTAMEFEFYTLASEWDNKNLGYMSAHRLGVMAKFVTTVEGRCKCGNAI